jgi:serine/threonine protein kinase
MSKMIENYLLDEVLGSGQYGKVYKGKHTKTGDIVAVKVVKLGKFREIPKLYEFTMNEINTLSRIENPNIIKFIEMLRSKNNIYLVYEYCGGGTLEELLTKRKFLSEREALDIFSQILNAFKSLAPEGILHRDLKPSNILFHDNTIKIADFGFCKALLNGQQMTKTMVGSPIYMAPEILKGFDYSIKADIWSMGVVLFECLFGFCPYEDRTIARLINQIDHKPLAIPKHINKISKNTEDLMRKMLVVDPRKRIEWTELLQAQIYEPSPVVDIPLSGSLMPSISPKNNITVATGLPVISQQNFAKKGKVENKENIDRASSPLNRVVNKENIPQSKSKTVIPSRPLIIRQENTAVFHKPMAEPLGVNMNLLNKVDSHHQHLSTGNIHSVLTKEIPGICLSAREDREKRFNRQLRVLLRERNKIVFMTNTINLILESSNSSRSPKISYLIMNRISQIADKLKSLTQELKNEKELGEPDMYRVSEELKNFEKILESETEQIIPCLKLFKEQWEKTPDDTLRNREDYQRANECDEAFFSRNLLEFIREIKDGVIAERSDSERKKLLLLGHDMLDVLIIDEFFKNFIDENTNYQDQKYFEKMRRYNNDNLLDLFNQKLEYANNKYPPSDY